MTRFVLAVTALVQRELVRFWRDRGRVVGMVASPLLFWLILAFGAGGSAPAFFFPGMLLATVLFSAIFSTMSIIEDRREGFLLAMLVSPAPRSSLVLGKVLGTAVLAWLQACLLLAFAPLAGMAADAGLAGAAGVLFLAAVGLSGLGFWIAWKFDSAPAYHAVMNLVLLPMWLVSGALFSPGTASGWMRVLMWANPLTYALAALRRVLTPGQVSGEPRMGLSLTISVAFAVLMIVGSALAARRHSSGSQE